MYKNNYLKLSFFIYGHVCFSLVYIEILNNNDELKFLSRWLNEYLPKSLRWSRDDMTGFYKVGQLYGYNEK